MVRDLRLAAVLTAAQDMATSILSQLPSADALDAASGPAATAGRLGQPLGDDTPDPDRTKPIVADAMAIDGWLRPEEASLLLEAAESGVLRHPDAVVVEIGSYLGRSTAVLAGALAASGVDSTIVSVDPHRGAIGAIDSPFGLRIADDTYNGFRDNLSRLGLRGFVEILRLHSFEVNWDRPISLLYIDGAHDAVSVQQDLRRFSPWIVDGGLLACHDNSEGFPGVVAEIQQLLSTGRFVEIRREADLIVLERRAPEQDSLWRTAAVEKVPGRSLEGAESAARGRFGVEEDARELQAELSETRRLLAEQDVHCRNLGQQLQHQEQLNRDLAEQLQQYQHKVSRFTAEIAQGEAEYARQSETLTQWMRAETQVLRESLTTRRAENEVLRPAFTAEANAPRESLVRETESVRQALGETIRNTEDLLRERGDQIRRVEVELAECRLELSLAEDYIRALRTSISWRLTSPLRTVGKLLQRRR